MSAERIARMSAHGCARKRTKAPAGLRAKMATAGGRGPDGFRSHTRWLGVISTQVMQEYAVNALDKLKQALPMVMHQLHLLESLETVVIKPASVRRALEIFGIYGISYWDVLIVAAAEQAGYGRILSEDLNTGQFYCGIECVNPFARVV